MGRQGTPRTDASRASLAHRVGAYVSAHRLRRRWLALMGVLAAVVVVVTAGALTMPASTMTADVATLPEGASVPEGYTQQYTAKDEANGITVTAYAPEGVVPEGATLKASLLAQDSDEYVAAKQATGATDEEGAGFAAMDISFVDVDGNEVEPTGDVYVNIDAAGILPEDADPESVTVQHLAEDENGSVASVDTVADTDDATEGVAAVAADDATAVRAAFSTDGFSTFTITWTQWDNVKEANVGCYFTNTDTELPTGDGPKSFTVSNGQTIAFDRSSHDERFDFDTSNYQYDGASYWNGWSWQTLNSLRVEKKSFNHGWNINVNDQYFGGDFPQIRLYYSKVEQGGGGQGGGTVTQNATVTTGKTAVLKNDGSGNYDLTLTVSGDRGTSENKQKVDVLFILDESNSMMERWSGDTRIAQAKKAIAQITGFGQYEGLSDNDKLDVQYALVGFYGGNSTKNNPYRDASKEQSWTSSAP